MSKDIATGGSVVLRATMSMVVFWCVAGLALLFIVDALVRGRWDVGLRAAAGLSVVVWIAWVLLYRMSIVADRDAVTVRNVLRLTRVPWGQVVDIERRYQVRILLRDGARIECWGSPFPQRTGARGSTRPGMGLNTGLRGITSDGPDAPRPGVLPDPAVQTLRTIWGSAAVDAGGAVRRQWDVGALVVGVVCAVCALIAALV